MVIWELDLWLVTVGRVVARAGSATAPTGADAPATDSTDWVATLVGPAVVAALVTVLIGGLITYLATKSKERSAALLDLRVKSLNEFYAPIKSLLGGNKVLSGALRAEFGVAEGESWHMLDHLDEINANPAARKIVAEVLEINRKIGEILESKSGLDLGQSTNVAEWEVHRRLLDRAFTGAAGASKGNLTYFPRRFEEDIVKMHKELLDAVKSSVGMKTI
ncbi:hypothetical protein [Nocardioides houyundeii]|uniref:hypothetical protein n=1 Tax=Nocardioides houyundeii TaxID=2045452 RepID=UPI000DF3A730|nr:hypothetical protein [Nocardioides houyundeii]